MWLFHINTKISLFVFVWIMIDRIHFFSFYVPKINQETNNVSHVLSATMYETFPYPHEGNKCTLFQRKFS